MPTLSEYILSKDPQTLPIPGTKLVDLIDPVTGAVTKTEVSNIGTGAAASNPVVQTLVDGPIITMNIASGKWAFVEIGGNRTFAFSGLTAGDAGVITVKQDTTGGRTLIWPGTAFLASGGIALSTGANELTHIYYSYDGTRLMLSKENFGAAVIGGDAIAPLLISASISNSSKDFVDMFFNEALNGAIVPEAGSFTIAGKTIIATTISGGLIVRAQVSVPFVFGDAPQISYVQGTNKIQDISGNLTANFGPINISNNIAAPGDTTAPTVLEMAVTDSFPDRIYISASEFLQTSPLPAVGSFTPSGGKTVLSALITDALIQLNLSSAYAYGDVITLGYTAGVNPIKDLAGNNLASFAPQAVINSIASSGFIAPTEAILLLVSGQSNAVGRAANSASEVAVTNNTAYEYRPDTNSLKWLVDPTGQPGQYWTATDNSFNPNLAKRLYELTGKQVIVVVSARGNTGIDVWTTKTNAEYVNMKTFWNQMVSFCAANGITVAGKYAIWHQGENDAGVKEVDAYMAALNTVTENFIKDIVVDKVFIGRIGYNPTYASAANSEKIFKAQGFLNFSKDEMILASKAPSTFTIGNGKMAADNVHYTVLGLNELGEDYAEAIQEFRANNKKINLSSEPIVALQDPVDYFDDIYNFRSLKPGVNNTDYNEMWGRNNLTLGSGSPVSDGQKGLLNSAYSILTPETIRELTNTFDWSIDITFRANSTSPGMLLNGRATVWTEDWLWLNAANTIQLKGNNVTKTSAAIANANWSQPTTITIVYRYLTNTCSIYMNGVFSQSFTDWAFASFRIGAILRGHSTAPSSTWFNGYVERVRIVKKALDAWEIDKSPNMTGEAPFDYDFQFNSSIAEAQSEITSAVRLYSDNTVTTPTYDADGIVLTGTTDYFKLARQIAIYNGDFTMEIRMKFAVNTGTQYMIAGQIQPSDSTGSLIYITGTPFSSITVSDASGVNFTLPGGFDATIFHVYKFVYTKATNTIQLYIDGVLNASKSQVMTKMAVTSLGSGVTAGSRFSGTIDWFKVKNSL